jgi:aminopeptidase N
MRRGWQAAAAVLLGACATAFAREGRPPARDVHSRADPEAVRVAHLALDLTVDFEARRLSGTARLKVVRAPGAPADGPLRLDARGLEVRSVRAREAGGPWREVAFEAGPPDATVGPGLVVALPAGPDEVEVAYRTVPAATALQWVPPAGTAGGEFPFLYTQSQSIHARTWIPCQDSPGVKATYEATVRVPAGLTAVMSAESKGKTPEGAFRFAMERPVPAYLIALAVGDLAFRPLGPRTGVWAEPSVVDRAAAEFADTGRMLEVAERRFGAYPWGRYDLLVLPPSFPFGGMENARLTFVTPTVLAGDRSLVALVAHELAHSWAGNLVTCATWESFWLNEGLTTYLERRIVEDVFGKDRAATEGVIGRAELERELADAPDGAERLDLDLDGEDPEGAINSIPYEKGALFLTRLETAFGRERWDAFLKGYFAHFAFKSLSTADFEAYLKATLYPADPEAARAIDLDAWLRGPGIPADAPVSRSDGLARVGAAASGWAAGTVATADLAADAWSTAERVHFLRALPERLPPSRLAELDGALHLTARANAEVLVPWLLLAIRSGYAGSDERLEAFLTTVGRRKYVVPLYEALAATPAGRARAEALFARAKPGYHPLTSAAVAGALKPR